ncbi:hypothetical protein [Glaciecola sp. MF2-115]|uniref:hypothetical protein n=1 Tax=Glaciecola sp. MF2-115 TaxID=3384827 RepID=UPI0039A0897C
MQTPKRFIFFFGLCSVLFILFVGMINYVVNPFLMFQQTKVNDIFTYKPEAATRVQTFKKYQAEGQNYDVLIVGNSRVEMGLNPDSPYFKDKHVYNAGVPGLSMPAQIAYAKNLVNSNNIETLYVGVDFVDFISRELPNLEDFKFESNKYDDYLSATFSLDALKASLMTIFNQSQYASTRTYKGFNPAKDYIATLQSEGQAVLTSQKLRALFTKIEGTRFHKQELMTNVQSPINVLEKNVNDWVKNGKRVVIFINPYQDLYYDALAKSGLANDFEIWRSAIKKVANNTDSAFYDFTDLGMLHSNMFNEENELKYFWEPAHYKKGLGDKMLEIMSNNDF